VVSTAGDENNLLILQTSDGEAVSLALLATVPLTVAPVSVGGSIQSSWWNQNTSGLFRCGCDEEYNYTPLYALKRIKKPGIRWRDSPVPESENDDLSVALFIYREDRGIDSTILAGKMLPNHGTL
jgi:hypothetical protein